MFVILGLVFFLYKESKNPIQKNTEINLEDSVVKKSIDEVDGLLELADKEKAVVVQIKNKEELVKFDAVFSRAYQNDLVIFLPKQTIIYDSSTKTIRDISDKSFYEQNYYY